MIDGVDVLGRIVEVGGDGGDEFRTGGTEEFFEKGEGFGAAALETQELLAVFFAEGGVDRVVEAGGLEGDADGDQGVHLLVLFGDGVVGLGAFLEVLGARDVDEDVGEHADGVGVAAEHHVAEADVVVSSEVGGHDAGEHGFFVHFDVVESFEGQGEIAEEAVNSQEADYGEVAEHFVERARTVFSSYRVLVFATLHGCELFVDLGALDKGVEDVEDGVTTPCVWILFEELSFLFV